MPTTTVKLHEANKIYCQRWPKGRALGILSPVSPTTLWKEAVVLFQIILMRKLRQRVVKTRRKFQ